MTVNIGTDGQPIVVGQNTLDFVTPKYDPNNAASLGLQIDTNAANDDNEIAARAALFDAANGHKHSGGVGDGPVIPGGNVAQDATHRMVTDAEKTTWNGKSNIVVGFFTGDDAASKFINLGFTPKCVAVVNAATGEASGKGPGMAVTGSTFDISAGHTGIAITTNGFYVYEDNASSVYFNNAGYRYNYSAF